MSKIMEIDKELFYNIIEEIMDFAVSKNLKIATAESCTGGMLGAYITSVSGSSRFFMKGYIVYSNEAKIELLNIDEETLKNYGAVSSENAKAMALGALKNVDISVAITGVAGPGGGKYNKPIGTVHIAIATKNGVNVKSYLFDGDRDFVRHTAVQNALLLLLNCVKHY